MIIPNFIMHFYIYLEAEIAVAKFKQYKLPGSDQIPAELIQAGGQTLLSARKREHYQ
jgi:hypothetical protein